MSKDYLFKSELLCWDNEGGGDGGAGGGDGGAGGGDGGAGGGDGGAGGGDDPQAGITENPNTGRKFTQEEVNKYVADRNKALKTKFEKMEQSYETLLQQQNLTSDQRDQLESQLESVRMEMMTEKQRLEAERKKAEKHYEENLSKAQDEANKYKKLFETSTLTRAITDAAAKHEAFNPQHFTAHLMPKSKMAEASVDGQPTGELVPKVEWTEEDEKGQTIVTLITPEEAVMKMKENVGEFGNLFRSNVAAGIGAGTAPGQTASTGTIDHSRISTDEYMELAKTAEGRRRLGLAK